MQTIFQWLSETSGGNQSTCFKGIVPKLYKEFSDIFAKKSLDGLPNWKQMYHTIELIPDAQTFSTKVYLRGQHCDKATLD